MGQNVYVRPLELKDSERIKYIDNNGDFTIYDFIEDMLESNYQDYAYGIFLNDELIGYATIGGADEIDKANCDDELLSDVFILDEFQNNGYGKILVQEVCNAHSKSNIWIDVIHDGLFSWYKDFGFERIYSDNFANLDDYGLMILKRK